MDENTGQRVRETIVRFVSCAAMTVGLVERPHLENWASWPEAQSLLPELVRRLVVETTDGAADAHFSSGKGVHLGGFDGRVEGAPGSMWVPPGSSVWELSTEARPGPKAGKDFKKRTAARLGRVKRNTSYVALSLRPWSNTDEWEAERTGLGWRSVKALGLDHLVSWLGEAPQTELWLADQLGLQSAQLTPGRRWWQERLDCTGGLLGAPVLLAGRSGAAEALREQLESKKSPIIVEAVAVEDALDFIAAVCAQSLEAVGDSSTLDRTVFVHGPDAWTRLMGSHGSPMVLVPTDPVLGDMNSGGRHVVVAAVQRRGGASMVRLVNPDSADVVVVPRLDAREVTEALNTEAARARGIDYAQAYELGVTGHRSASALQRELSLDRAVQVPWWAQFDAAMDISTWRARTAALLAGEWSAHLPEYARSTSDRDVMERLAGGPLDYESIQIALGPLASGPDPMLTKSEDRWRLASAADAWIFLFDSVITPDALARFLQVTTEVLGDSSDSWQLTSIDPAEAGASRLRCSTGLRFGIARSLVLLRVHGDQVRFPHGVTAATRARSCIRQLLALNASGESSPEADVYRIVSLNDVLPLIAEAAPADFLEFVARILDSGDDTTRLLFTDVIDGSGSWLTSSPHLALLSAIETVAWLPDLLSEVTSLLFRLESVAPVESRSKRPVSTFASVFSAWAPQTGATPDERLAVLRGLLDRLTAHPDASIDDLSAATRLLGGLIPVQGASVMMAPRPRIRDFPSLPVQVTEGDITTYVGEVVSLLLNLTRYRIAERADAGGLLDLLAGATGVTIETALNKAAREELWAIVELAASVLPVEDAREVGERLAHVAEHHASFPDARRAMSVDETQRVASLAEQLAPPSADGDDLAAQHSWLFEAYEPSLGIGLSPWRNRDEYEQRLTEHRGTAVRELLDVEGLNGVLRLADLASERNEAASPSTVGSALAILLHDNVGDSNQIAPESSIANIGATLHMALRVSLLDTAADPGALRQAQVANGFFATSFRLQREEGNDPWSPLAALLRDPTATALQQAQLLSATRDYPRAWREAKSHGDETLAELWKRLHWIDVPRNSEDLEQTVEGLLGVNRARDAIDLLAHLRNSSGIRPERRAVLVTDALEALAEDDTQLTRGDVERWAIKELIDFLAEHYPVRNLNPELLDRLARLVLKFLWTFNLGDGTPFVHEQMALDPSAFVEMVRGAYQPSGDSAANSSAASSPPGPTSREDHGSACYRVLHSWSRPPGVNQDGLLDGEVLRAWTIKAQQLLDEVDRREIGDLHIGRVLSAAPADLDDHIAPATPIRQLLEEGQTDVFEQGLLSGLISGPTGMRGGWLKDLKISAEAAATRHLADARVVGASSPRTARLLREAAEARQQDARAHQSDLDRSD